jgi:hypothetical protein
MFNFTPPSATVPEWCRWCPTRSRAFAANCQGSVEGLAQSDRKGSIRARRVLFLFALDDPGVPTLKKGLLVLPFLT